jgi:hypothetical protein
MSDEIKNTNPEEKPAAPKPAKKPIVQKPVGNPFLGKSGSFNQSKSGINPGFKGKSFKGTGVKKGK